MVFIERWPFFLHKTGSTVYYITGSYRIYANIWKKVRIWHTYQLFYFSTFTIRLTRPLTHIILQCINITKLLIFAYTCRLQGKHWCQTSLYTHLVWITIILTN